MNELELKQVSKLLGLTEQQLEILMSIYSVEIRGEKATTPKNIEEEYTRNYKKLIQSSNLFHQMKTLLEKGLILREKKAKYKVNFEQIKRILKQRKETFLKQLEDFESLSKETENYFRKVALTKIRPTVEYLELSELYQKIAKSLEHAKTFHVVENFPLISYTYPLSDGIDRTKYAETLWERCFKNKDLKVLYLTDLDIDFLFNHALRVYRDPKIAYKECKLVIEQLENQIETYPENLDIRFLEVPYGLDIAIPESRERGEIKDFFLFMRDEHKDISGGIYIRSPETAISAKQKFMREFEYAERIQGGKKGRGILSKVKKNFEEKYGVCRS